MNATMYALQTVNVRTLPDTDGEKLGALSTNQEITVTGQCNETGWYRFEYNNDIAYVSNNYISDTKIEESVSDPAPEPEQSASSSTTDSSGSGGFDINDYPVSQWIDMGDWYFYIHPVYGERPPFTTSDPEYMDRVAILQAKYPDRTVNWAHGYDSKRLSASIYFIDAWPVENRAIYDIAWSYK